MTSSVLIISSLYVFVCDFLFDYFPYTPVLSSLLALRTLTKHINNTLNWIIIIIIIIIITIITSEHSLQRNTKYSGKSHTKETT